MGNPKRMTDIGHPPPMPTKSSMTVRRGMMAVAIMLGVHEFLDRVGCPARAHGRSARSLSLEPSSLAIPDALRPATMTAGPGHRSSLSHEDRSIRRFRCGRFVRTAAGCGPSAWHDGSVKRPGEADDRDAADADCVHLQQDVVDVVGFSGEVQDGPAGQKFVELLNPPGWGPSRKST